MRTLVSPMILAGGLMAQEGPACTERTIKGSYGFTFIGTRPASPAPGAPIVEGRGVGIRIFDGQGSFAEVSSVKSVNNPALVDNRFSGTYKNQPGFHGNGTPRCAGYARRRIPVRRGQERQRDLLHSRKPDRTDDSNACRPTVKLRGVR